ncbi:hypothetical protein ABIE50_004160 [Chitinophaga sp. OAE865]
MHAIAMNNHITMCKLIQNLINLIRILKLYKYVFYTYLNVINQSPPKTTQTYSSKTHWICATHHSKFPSAHTCISTSTGFNNFPFSVNEYSTVGGIVA